MCAFAPKNETDLFFGLRDAQGTGETYLVLLGIRNYILIHYFNHRITNPKILYVIDIIIVLRRLKDF